MNDNDELLLKEAGATAIKFYMLINNYGYTFIKNGIKYDLRFWANCYGCALNHWSISGGNTPIKDNAFKTVADACKVIKQL